MRSLLFAVFFALSLAVSAEESGEEEIRLTPWAELAAPSAEYNYSIPKPGSYDLPAVKMALNGTVLGTNGAPVRLFDLMNDRIVVLSFIYTRCGDPRACIKATGV